MKSFFSVLAALSLLVTGRAVAGERLCSSADQRASLAYAYPDGGAPFWPRHEIKLDSEVVYQSDWMGGAAIEKATYAETDATDISFSPMTAQTPQIQITVEMLTLRDKLSGTVLFADRVLCRDVSRPCPLCP